MFTPLLSSPLGRIWWSEMAGDLNPEFRAEVERLAAENAAPSSS
jgi:hypothetical protein